jgi:DNA-binding SARP family transcriptional activator
VRIDISGREIVTGLRSDTRRLLTLLALHPDGLSAAAIFQALWPHADPRGPDIQLLYTAANKGRAALRKLTGTRDVFILHRGDRYQLDAEVVACDVWDFDGALTTAARTSDLNERIVHLHRAAQMYCGDVAADNTEEWVEAFREGFRRKAAQTFTIVARHHSRSNPDTAIDWFDRALQVDPYNEELFGEIMKLHATLGRPDAVRRTFERLKSTMAELDCEPDESSLRLLRRLVGKRPGRPLGESQEG